MNMTLSIDHADFGNRNKSFSKKGSLLYRFARILMRIYCALFFNLKVMGLENIPNDQNFILLANHVNAWDPILIAVSVRTWALHFLAKESLFKIPIVSRILPRVHILKVARGGGSNLATMRSALEILRGGGALGIFPEGRRYQTGKLERLESGIAVLAASTDVPLLPAHISGVYNKRGRLLLQFGKPLTLSDLRSMPKDANTFGLILDRLACALNDLVPE